MKLPNYKRIYPSDFSPDDQPLVNQMSTSVNPNIEVLYQALNGNVSLKDNIYAEVKEFTTNVNSAGIPNNTLQYNSSLATSILGITVLRARHSTRTDVFPTSAPFISFTQSGKTVTINNITGLPANQDFALVIVAYGS